MELDHTNWMAEAKAKADEQLHGNVDGKRLERVKMPPNARTQKRKMKASICMSSY